jgi:hypothetical protein
MKIYGDNTMSFSDDIISEGRIRYIMSGPSGPTLRDQFAMAALPAISQWYQDDEPGLAKHAYAIADAMMEERNKPTPPINHLWSNEQVAELKRKGLIVEDEDEPLTNEQIRAEKEQIAALVATPVSDPEKFKRCTDCGAEIPIDKYCEECLPF